MDNFKVFKNKKGDVPVTILVLGVFVVCSLALVSFYLASFKVENNFVGLELMDKMNYKIKEYNFYKLKGLSKEQFAENVPFEENFFLGNENSKTYFEINETGKIDIGFWNKEKFLFSIKYYVSED